MNYDFNLTVWQTQDCVRCGGCCYACLVEDRHYLKMNSTLCERLQINVASNNTSCIVYGKDKQPRACREFFCGSGELYSMELEVFGRLKIARVVLDSFKLKPVPNAQEIREELERMHQELKIRNKPT